MVTALRSFSGTGFHMACQGQQEGPQEGVSGPQGRHNFTHKEDCSATQGTTPMAPFIQGIVESGFMLITYCNHLNPSIGLQDKYFDLCLRTKKLRL